jgi:hypothetical protein
VWAEPLAQLSRTRHGLLLFPEGALAPEVNLGMRAPAP